MKGVCMTCIVGLLDGEDIYIGGDSAGVNTETYTIAERKDEKVFKNGEFIFGFTSSFRMGQLLRYAFNPPPYYTDVDLYKYMVTDFVDSIRKCLKEGGYARTKEGEETGGTFLVGYKGRLFMIDCDYQVAEHSCPYFSVGCGEEYAKGCLYALQDTDMTPEEKITKALEAAEKFSVGVAGPFNIIKTGG